MIGPRPRHTIVWSPRHARHQDRAACPGQLGSRSPPVLQRRITLSQKKQIFCVVALLLYPCGLQLHAL